MSFVCSTITRVKLSYSLQNSLQRYIIDSSRPSSLGKMIGSYISEIFEVKIFLTFFSNRNFSRMVLSISSKFIDSFVCDIYFIYVKFYGNIFIFFPTLPPQPIGPAGGPTEKYHLRSQVRTHVRSHAKISCEFLVISICFNIKKMYTHP